MVGGLRQRTISTLSTSPLTKPNIKNTKQQLLHNRRRMKRRRRGWEARIKFRVVCINLCTCCLLVGILGVLYQLPFSKLVKRTSFQKQPSLSTTQHKQQSKIVYNFQCTSNPKQYGILNDNYCDCLEDGSDEPNTSACSHLLVGKKMFNCDNAKISIQNGQQIRQKNSNRRRRLLDRLRGRIVDNTNHDSSSGNRGVMIYTSRVHDGVIDCPNQVDEL